MKKEILAIIAVLLVSMPSGFAFGKITGFIPTNGNEFKALAGFDIESISVYELGLDIPQGSRLSSIKISGKVEGEGKANAFLEDSRGRWYVIFNYNSARNPFAKAMTGMFEGMSSALSGDSVPELSFENKCVETCFLEGDFSGDIYLVFDVGENTKLEIHDISYTFDESSPTLSFRIGKLFSDFLHFFD